MVAYGIYKRHKIEFIDSIRKEYDRELASFVMDSAGEQIKDAEKRMLEQY